MDVFNRLKNTVSGVMMGNPVTREFEISTHRASAGPGLLWKVYDGIKYTTKQVSMGQSRLIVPHYLFFNVSCDNNNLYSK